MFCVVKCPWCSKIQGREYPLKSTKCQRCGRAISVSKHPPIHTCGSADEMRAVILAAGWEGERELKDILEEVGDNTSGRASTGDLRDELLDIIDQGEEDENRIYSLLVSRGYTSDVVERAFSDLELKGVIFHPISGKVRAVSRH
ncbi:MAG: hypothetical protein ACMUIE_05030 [Thermoplasmatota archaeon]